MDEAIRKVVGVVRRKGEVVACKVQRGRGRVEGEEVGGDGGERVRRGEWHGEAEGDGSRVRATAVVDRLCPVARHACVALVRADGRAQRRLVRRDIERQDLRVDDEGRQEPSVVAGAIAEPFAHRDRVADEHDAEEIARARQDGAVLVEDGGRDEVEVDAGGMVLAGLFLALVELGVEVGEDELLVLWCDEGSGSEARREPPRPEHLGVRAERS